MISGSRHTFGDLKVKEVTIDDLYFVQQELLKTRKTQTVNDYMALVKHLMKDAMKERIIDYDPCVLLNNLRRKEEKARDTYHRALSIKEQSSFFACDRAKSSYYYNVFRFAILTGMRCGEIGALKYGDVRDNLIHVERTITRTEYGTYIIGENAKTACGRRTIPVNDRIRDVIKTQKIVNETLDGKKATKDSLLFKAPERGLLMSTPMDREIHRICKTIKIEPFAMHAFRDTFATRAIENGMNPRTLQEILGHSNFNLTMSLYGHVLNDTMIKAMDELDIEV
jgi:integrase